MEVTLSPRWTRTTPWRQGQVLGTESINALKLVDSEYLAECAVVVISHDCDVANDNLIAEPFVEVVIGRKVAAAKGDFAWGKSPRTLHLEYSRADGRVFIELVATQKTLIDKNHLAQFLPDATYYLSQKSLYVLRNWLSVRYNRAAYPDQFINRMKDTKLDEKLANRIRKYPDISTVFFDLDRGEDRDHSDGSPYELSVILAYAPGEESDITSDQVSSAEEEIKQLFVDRAYDPKTKSWNGIALRKCLLVSEDDITIAQSRKLSQWRLEHLSLRADDDQPVPCGVHG